MRLCRYEQQGVVWIGFYSEDSVIPLTQAAQALSIAVPASDSLLTYLPGGASRAAVRELSAALEKSDAVRKQLAIPVDSVSLRVPVPNPSKLLLLAGNYSAHIEEGGGKAEERARTFPYVFMKPPLTTLTDPGKPIRIPAVSPDHVDWELELGVIMGQRCHAVREADALSYVAGYTVVNDISDRKFKPNPSRNKRDKDNFFDWLHGKWHDTFCPMGPCVLPADELADPQTLKLTLKLNGEVRQDASTKDMVFPVAALIEFISSFVTLEPGDIISTGTPAGVGNTTGTYVHSGDVLDAHIEKIGNLRNPVV